MLTSSYGLEFTDIFWDYCLFITAAGAIGIIIGLVIRNIWDKNR